MKWPSFLAILLLAACAAPGGPVPRPAGRIEVPNRYARCFQVFRHGAAREVIVFGPAGRTDTIAHFRTRSVDADAANDAAALPPLGRIAVLSTTHLPFISALERTDRVVAATFLDRVRDQAVRDRVAAGAVIDIGTADGIDHERLLVAGAQAVLGYPFGQAMHRAVSPGQVYVPITEYLEEHPLGRAEWLRFFGVLLDAEERADSLFAAIEERYEHAARRAIGADNRPRVFFGSAWQGQWHVPPGNSYMAHLIADAGGEYCFADRVSSGNIALDLEAVIGEARSADRFGAVLAHGGQLRAIGLAGGDPRIASLPVMRSGAFYLDSERSDIFGQALLEPDVLLEELACVFHPGTCTTEGMRYVLVPGQ